MFCGYVLERKPRSHMVVVIIVDIGNNDFIFYIKLLTTVLWVQYRFL